MRKIVYVKYSNERDDRFKIKTVIEQDENGARYVKKYALTEAAKTHIEDIKRHEAHLAQCTVGTKLIFNHCRLGDGYIDCDYVKGEPLSLILNRKIMQKDEDGALKLIQEYCSQLQQIATEPFVVTEEFEQVFGKVKFDREQKSCKVTDIDLIFSNILVDGNNWNVIDLEWTFDFPVPVNFLIYRAVVNAEKTVRSFLEEHWSFLGIQHSEVSTFAEMERVFLSYVGKKEIQLCNMAHLQKRKSLAEINAEVADKERQIQNLNNHINNQNHRINDLNNHINNQNHRINDLNNHINNQNNHIVELNNQIAGITSSRSWWLTKPLRVLIQKIRANKYTYLIAKGIKSLLCNGIGVTWKKMQNKLLSNELKAEHHTICYRVNHALRNYGLFGTMKKALKKAIQKIYIVSRRYNWMQMPLKLIKRVVQKLFPKLRNTLDQSLYQAKIHMYQRSAENGNYVNAVRNWFGEKAIPFAEKPLVSIIVPNYNHSAYLRDRLESVYNQSYSNFEVILLDDCSTDNSREILMEYANRYPEKTIVDFNEVNGGKVFKQWNKGFEHARGKLIWVAESDDWCDLDFLEKMVPQFEYQSVMLAFCNSIFMQDGEKVWSLGEYLADIPALNFGTTFMMSAHTAVNTAFAIKNIVPNVSSAMFRNVGQIPSEITDIWQNFKLCGDWLFYLHTIKGGTVSYTNETTNYYRVHRNSTSLKIQKTPEYYMEQEQISRFIVENYNVDLKMFEKVLYNLEQHYKAIHETDDVAIVRENYQIERIAGAADNRQLNILMCCYSLQMGGGETYPVFLANEMKRQGGCVTLLNFNQDEYSQEVRNLLNPEVPLINLENADYLGDILMSTGADVIHSHHASIDQMVSVWLQALPTKCKQVISLHGMYETVDKENCLHIFENIQKTCGQFVYTADKNLSRIKELGFMDRFPLIKVGNALPVKKITPVDRRNLNISDEDFVLCLVSRAIKDKGWQEAVDAVIAANRRSWRKIHLILIGDGPMKKKLEDIRNPYIHVLGQKVNIRDYFATADMGFLPSAFHGESFPLVVIDSLMTGRPVLASNIGEIYNMLNDGTGEVAGALFELDNWKIDVDTLADLIVEIAQNPEQYQQMVDRVPGAMDKFDISKIVHTYLNIYHKVINSKE